MKQLIKYSGVIVIIIAVLLLGIYFYANPASNILLVISGLLLLVGLFGYIITNKLVLD
ncbi:MAG: hypothetical protein FWH18_05935 [Marinilabiliaceae bacterium]|nr:hypothetical protein [Marinilabiliaceae bacterium]